jgi:peptidyl-tRNA hydrolase, PTH1 family
MRMIVGLGNPGKEYERTRHNVGFMVVDALQQEMSKSQALISEQISNLNLQYQNKFDASVVKLNEYLLVKPQTFMNKSGEAVARVARFYKIPAAQICVVHDDLDIELGKKKIQLGKGPRIHNGVNSVEQSLGTTEFWRIRIGIDGRDPEEKTTIPGHNYVLSPFKAEERNRISAVIDEVVEAIRGGWDGFV